MCAQAAEGPARPSTQRERRESRFGRGSSAAGAGAANDPEPRGQGARRADARATPARMLDVPRGGAARRGDAPALPRTESIARCLRPHLSHPRPSRAPRAYQSSSCRALLPQMLEAAPGLGNALTRAHLQPRFKSSTRKVKSCCGIDAARALGLVRTYLQQVRHEEHASGSLVAC